MKRTVLTRATTGLAGALAIAGGSSAYGAIVNVAPPADLTNTPGGGTVPPGGGTQTGTFSFWDVNSDGTNDFFFFNRYPNTAPGGSGVVWQENMNPATAALATTNGVISYAGAFVRYGTALTLGSTIGPAQTTFSTATQVTLGSRYSYGAAGVYNYGGFASGPNATTGAVAPGTNAYAGFRFNAADGTHYGWVLLNVNTGLIDFTSAAYQSTPATAITAGATAVPEPGTMAALALGAVAVGGSIIKRRRAVVA